MGLISTLRGLLFRPPALQVAMLCSRPGPDGPEVLLVRSLESRRWIIPKGWPMDGRTLRDAATLEAWEEAGATGQVWPAEFARFPSYKRRGGGFDIPTEVVVFRMEDTVLADIYPEADKRERQFLPVAQAAARADIEQLGALIRRSFP